MNRDNHIAKLTKEFAKRVVKLYQFLSEEKHEYTLSRQLLRCGTSIGANVRESIYAQSRADFISKLSIALKESSETEYWLELLYETEILDEHTFKSIYDDNCRISATLINIIKRTKDAAQ